MRKGNTVKEKQKDKSMSMKIIMSVMVLTITILGYQGVRLVRVSQQLDQQLKQTRKEAAIEGQKLEALEAEYENIDSLKNIEKIARDKLGLVKNDEIVFRVKP